MSSVKPSCLLLLLVRKTKTQKLKIKIGLYKVVLYIWPPALPRASGQKAGPRVQAAAMQRPRPCFRGRARWTTENGVSRVRLPRLLTQPEAAASGSPTTGEPGRGGAAAGTGQGAAAARAAVAAAAACRGPQAQLERQSNPFAPPCGDQIVTPPAQRLHGTPTLQCCKQYCDAYCVLL